MKWLVESECLVSMKTSVIHMGGRSTRDTPTLHSQKLCPKAAKPLNMVEVWEKLFKGFYSCKSSSSMLVITLVKLVTM